MRSLNLCEPGLVRSSLGTEPAHRKAATIAAKNAQKRMRLMATLDCFAAMVSPSRPGQWKGGPEGFILRTGGLRFLAAFFEDFCGTDRGVVVTTRRSSSLRMTNAWG